MKSKKNLYLGIGVVMFLIGFILVWNALLNDQFSLPSGNILFYLIYIIYVVVMLFFFVLAWRRME